MRRRAAVAAALLSAGVFASPAYALFDDEEARRRIELLRQEMLERQRVLDERLKNMDTALTAASDRRALVDLSTQLEALRTEMARMRGQLEVLVNQAETVDRKQKDLYLDIDTRLRKLEAPREQAAAADKQAAAEGEASQAEARVYQAALEQFKVGNYPAAVVAMQNFLTAYPSSKLAPNAQYWAGMALSGQRDYKGAIAAQRRLLATWPDHDKAPDALLSIASAQETMGERLAARKTLEELVAKYPQSAAAASAKQRLAAAGKRPG